jgi:hypothetical protein
LLTVWAAPAKLALFARVVGMISMTGTHDFGLGRITEEGWIV